MVPGSELAPTVKSNNAFALELYDHARAAPGNLAMSPASISLALSMTWGGARGETAREMAQVLHLVGAASAVMASWGKLGTSLVDPTRKLKIRIANRLFGEQTYELEQAYLEQTRAAYGAALEPIDFATAEAARARINHWVETQTEKRIRDLLPQGSIDELTRLVLVNAIYFLADWKSPFGSENTHDSPFTIEPGRRPLVPTMHQHTSFRIAKADGITMLELPYQGGAAMWIVLPDEQHGLAEVESSLVTEKLERWSDLLRSAQLEVALPRFTIDPPDPLDLADILKACGMRLAFDGAAADFSGIARSLDPAQRLCLSAVFHKAFVKVDENGTEAAAATAVVMLERGPARNVEELKIDHPFLFFIVDKLSGLILFMGRVVDPVG